MRSVHSVTHGHAVMHKPGVGTLEACWPRLTGGRLGGLRVYFRPDLDGAAWRVLPADRRDAVLASGSALEARKGVSDG